MIADNCPWRYYNILQFLHKISLVISNFPWFYIVNTLYTNYKFTIWSIYVLHTHSFHIQSIIMSVEMYIVHNILIPMHVSVYIWGIGMQQATSNWLSHLELASSAFFKAIDVCEIKHWLGLSWSLYNKQSSPTWAPRIFGVHVSCPQEHEVLIECVCVCVCVCVWERERERERSNRDTFYYE